MLTAPRVYYAMAEDGVFFQSVGKVHPRTRVPILAIALQGIVAIIIIASGTYEQILSYVVAVDFIFFGLTGLALFVFRRRDPAGPPAGGFRTPGHPWTTGLFVAGRAVFVVNPMIQRPEALLGLAIVLTGVPAYLVWTRGRPA